jgi:ribonuclease HI
LNGKYPVKDQKLRILYLRAQTLLRRFDSYRMVHVYREMNEVADRLVNHGIDDAMGRNSTG